MVFLELTFEFKSALLILSVLVLESNAKVMKALFNDINVIHVMSILVIGIFAVELLYLTPLVIKPFIVLEVDRKVQAAFPLDVLLVGDALLREEGAVNLTVLNLRILKRFIPPLTTIINPISLMIPLA